MVLSTTPATKADKENTYIVNAFDRYAFANCPYEDERQEGVYHTDTFIPRIIAQYGKASISMECDFLKEYLSHFAEESIKRKASLVIKWNNWQNKIHSDLDEKLVKKSIGHIRIERKSKRKRIFVAGNTTSQYSLIRNLLPRVVLYMT